MSKAFERPIKLKWLHHYRFFVHSSEGIVELKQISITNGKLSGVVFPLQQPILYDENAKGRRIKSANRGITREVHSYLDPGRTLPSTGTVHLHSGDIDNVHMIKNDYGKVWLPGLITGIGIIGIIVVIILLTKSSYPYVYGYNGTEYIFEGEINSGAVLQNLERHDFLPLNSIKPDDREYKIKISNELHERQFINLAELLVVNHPEDSKVLFDKDGYQHVITSEVAPNKTTTGSGKDIMQPLNLPDTLHHMFNEVTTNDNHVILYFSKPKNIREGKLLLRGKNSM